MSCTDEVFGKDKLGMWLARDKAGSAGAPCGGTMKGP
jgi:hypothetical protein